MAQTQLKSLLEDHKNIHFVGIGGISMSALAEIMFNRGFSVTGSDMSDSDLIKHLKDLGIKVTIGHFKENINMTEVVIRTAAVKDDNVEILEARLKNIPVFERAVLLGAIMDDYPYPIAIAGTHGKTTTTSMTAEILLDAGCDPTCLVGGVLSSIGGNIRVGKSGYMVCEACEYVDSFLTLSPKIAVILNVEEDHPDYFSGIEQIISSFKRFANLAGPEGYVVYCIDNENAKIAVLGTSPHKLTFGIKDEHADVFARNINLNSLGFYNFDLYIKNEYKGRIDLRVPGIHNVLNALAACAASYLCDISIQSMARGLNAFIGTKRRFEYVGKYNRATVYDDYAHHPTEIKATLTAAKAMGYRRVICVFQPHTYTRTLALFDGFVEALKMCDLTILAEIYPAREKNIYNISSAKLAEVVPESLFLDSFDKIENYLKDNVGDGDLVLTMGAGDVYKIGRNLIG